MEAEEESCSCPAEPVHLDEEKDGDWLDAIIDNRPDKVHDILEAASRWDLLLLSNNNKNQFSIRYIHRVYITKQNNFHTMANCTAFVLFFFLLLHTQLSESVTTGETFWLQWRSCISSLAGTMLPPEAAIGSGYGCGFSQGIVTLTAFCTWGTPFWILVICKYAT